MYYVAQSRLMLVGMTSDELSKPLKVESQKEEERVLYIDKVKLTDRQRKALLELL